jgi:hypothetical protein
MITIAMETLKKIKSNHKTITVPWWVEKGKKLPKKIKFMDNRMGIKT